MGRQSIVLVAVISCSTASLAHGQGTAVYISADMEGVAGISGTDDPLARQLMTAEVNAAIQGAFDAGARRVLVNDSHGSHTNLVQTQLDPRVTLQRGDLKPYGMMHGLDSSYAGVIFIGYHGRAGSIGSHLAHTGTGRVGDLRVNGRSVSEGGMNALYAGWYGVPVVFISGDSVAVEQLKEVAPGAEGVSVKTGIWNRAVRSMSPDSAQAAIRRGVAAALRRQIAPPRVQAPFNVELQYRESLYADIAEGIPGVARQGPRTVGFTLPRYPEAYRLIRLLYKHVSP